LPTDLDLGAYAVLGYVGAIAVRLDVDHDALVPEADPELLEFLVAASDRGDHLEELVLEQARGDR
jgi:hypothetical protein